jgi:isoquinoline 1-oxidoreductase subunit beta
MKTHKHETSGRAALDEIRDEEYDEPVDRIDFHFTGIDLERREFLRVLGSGLLIAVTAGSLHGQTPGEPRRTGGRGGQGASTIAARLHIGQDGSLTVMTGKVECGQGARAELLQAAAEELRIKPDAVRLIMADTSLTPDDGGTFGSRTTPSTLPSVRRGCAAARELLASTAAKLWSVDVASIEIRDGSATDSKSDRALTYADLATDEAAIAGFRGPTPAGIELTPVASWKVLGKEVSRPNGRDIVTGSHQYPSDIRRPGMLYGKVLRRPSYGASLSSVDLEPARKMEGVMAVRDQEFVGVAADSAYLAEKALEAIAATARWETASHPSSAGIFEYLREHARGGVPANPYAEVVAGAAKSVRQAYQVPYVQHSPMEPRAAVAEWSEGSLTVWTATQNPFAVRGELARAFGIADDRVRVIIPDFGGGFGGKHSGECAVEAARLAMAAKKPVRLVWTRAEEFTWAAFRPAALIETEASLDQLGNISSWNFININSGANEIETPYRVGKSHCVFVPSEPPLRHGSYRALATTANTFGRECLMDELATAAGRDPLEFRLAHLEPGRLRDVLTEAASRFDWASRSKAKEKGVGVGLACGLDKGSFVAACVEVEVDSEQGRIAVRRVCQAFDCGKIINPANLANQVEGAIIMALGPALREESRFEEGRMLNAAFARYRVPRFADVPKLDIHLMDHHEHPSVGAGETPLIAVAPAIANAVFSATGQRMRSMPLRLANAGQT